MKKNIILFAILAAAVMTACQNKENGAPEAAPAAKGVLTKIAVNLDDIAKTSYTDEGNVLKTQWAAGDSIAVVSFNGTGQMAEVVSIDKFAMVSGAGEASAQFQGYFTGGDSPRVMVYYPPVNPYEYDELDMPKPDGYYGSKRINGAKGSKNNRAISELKVGSPYVHFNNGDYSHAFSSGDLTPVRERAVLYGDVAIDKTDPYNHKLGGVTMQNLYSVIRVTAVFPSALTTANVIKRISLESSKTQSFGPYGNWGYAADPDLVLTISRDYLDIILGESTTSESQSTGINLPADKTIVYYLVGAIADQPAGTQWTITAFDANGEEYSAKISLSSACSFEPGKMYRLTVNLQGDGSPAPPAATNLSPQNHTANCYVVASDAPGTYKFKNCKGTNFNYLNGAATEACVLWESLANGMNTPSVGDIIADATLYDDGYVYIQTTGERGNAVVAVKDDGGNILWSWHIWCTGSAFDPTADYHDADNFLYMKVNLGAFSYAVTSGASNGVGSTETAGLLYQFGRKDPFRGINNIYADNSPLQIKTTNAADWNYVACTAATGTVEYAHAHPMTFINPNDGSDGVAWGNMDWVYATTDELAAKDRWGQSNDDPCPYGWQVMTSSSDLASNDAMAYWSKSDYILNTDKYAGVNFTDYEPLSFPYAGLILENGIPVQRYDYQGWGKYNYFRYAGFYWNTTGGSTSYRQYLRIEDRKGYDNSLNEQDDNGAPLVTLDHTYNIDDMYYWSPRIGAGTAMSVRCVKNNN